MPTWKSSTLPRNLKKATSFQRYSLTPFSTFFASFAQLFNYYLLLSQFLKVIASRVPEMMDLLAYFFPVGLEDSPEKFRTEFPGLVETTLAQLKIIQDRASKGEHFLDHYVSHYSLNLHLKDYSSDLRQWLDES